MGNWLVCPNNGSRKVSIEVCLKRCEKRTECSELQELPREELHAVMRKLNLPILEDNAAIDSQALPDEAGPVIQTQGEQMDEEAVEDLAREPQIIVPQQDILTLPGKREPSQQAQAAFKRAMSIRTEIEVKFLEMGQVLDEIFSNRYHLDLGYTSEKVFCELALDIKVRTATYLRNIYLWQVQLEIPEKEVAEIGWSKAAMILPVAKTKKDAQKWIKKAKEPGVTAQILNAKVRVAQGKITEEEAKNLPVKVLLSLSPEQKEIWDRTVEVGKRVTGSESVSYIVTGSIFPEFLSTYPSGDEFDSKAEFVLMALMTFEAAYNVKVLGDVIDISTGEILVKGK